MYKVRIFYRAGHKAEGVVEFEPRLEEVFIDDKAEAVKLAAHIQLNGYNFSNDGGNGLVFIPASSISNVNVEED